MSKIKVIFLSVMALNISSAFAAEPKPQYVQVDSAIVRVKASQFASSAGTLNLGDKVKVTSKGKAWSCISSDDGKIKGWLPNSSLTTKKLIININGKTSANAKELGLAGKGMDKAFEKVYSQANEISYAQVDKIETNACSEKDAIAFLKEGQLNAGGEE